MSEDNNSEQTPYVLSELRGAVQWLTLNRPAQRNPLSREMIQALQQALDEAEANTAVRAIVIAGSGPVFSAGHNLKQMHDRDRDEASTAQRIADILKLCAAMMTSIVHHPKAVIACVQGTATAAGCQLVSACDLALAADHAKFCTPGVNIGSFCTTPLVGIGRNVSRKHAMELALTGDMISAEDAVRMGLINKAVPAEQLETDVTALADKIAGKSAQGIRAGKEAFYRQMDMPLEQAFEYASEEMVKAMMCEDAKEGIAAFFDKRTPQWGEA